MRLLDKKKVVSPCFIVPYTRGKLLTVTTMKNRKNTNANVVNQGFWVCYLGFFPHFICIVTHGFGFIQFAREQPDEDLKPKLCLLENICFKAL